MAETTISYITGNRPKNDDTEDTEKAQAIADSVIKAEVSHGWTHYVWDTFEKSPQERRFLFKVDAAILTIGCLGMKST
jgi:hypothetical protein